MTSTFEGLPVKGDIGYYSEQEKKPQKSAPELMAALHQVLQHDGVQGVVWTQYTPYFNDGEPCLFGLNLRGVILSDQREGELADYEIYDADSDVDLLVYDSWTMRETRPELSAALSELEGDLDSYQDVAWKAFGDPSHVVATIHGFTVTEHSHD